jgi:hypothetical protein
MEADTDRAVAGITRIVHLAHCTKRLALLIVDALLLPFRRRSPRIGLPLTSGADD